jgi:AcrR family transcriptional regulator
MPKPRGREVPTIQRQRILDEAIRLIGRSGYHGFTIQELAQRCDLTNGGLLYYFGSKELLLIAVLEERDRRAAAAIPASLNLARETPESGGYTQPAVLEIFAAIVQRSVAEPEILRLITVLQSEALDREHPAHDYFQKREARVLAEFANIVAGHADHPQSAARKLLALIMGLEQQWLRADQEFDLAAEFVQAVDLLLPDTKAAPVKSKNTHS